VSQKKRIYLTTGPVLTLWEAKIRGLDRDPQIILSRHRSDVPEMGSGHEKGGLGGVPRSGPGDGFGCPPEGQTTF